jgi:manganese/zinc/iron transport system permease protein
MLGLTYNTLIVLLGTGLLGANAGLVGSYAVLRGRALTGDALAHAALPGLCLAFLAVGERSLPAMMLGALGTGLLGVLVISVLNRMTRIKEDASIGIVLSVFFGLGIVLSRMIQNTSTTGSKAGLDSFILGKTAGILASDVAWIGGISLFSLAVIGLLYKELLITAFDPGFGRVQGWPVLVLDLGLMGLIALAVVFGLPAVGVVLMAALLILPAASARFWTDRLGGMLVFSTLIGLAIGVTGTTISASHTGMPAGPIITLVGTALFAISALFAPRRGVIARSLDQARLGRRLDDRALLRFLYEHSETDKVDDSPIDREALIEQTGWKRSRLDHVLSRGLMDGNLRIGSKGDVLPTPLGLDRGAIEARDERLWQLYLTEHPDQATTRTELFDTSPLQIMPRDQAEELEATLIAEGRWPRRLVRPEAHRS